MYLFQKTCFHSLVSEIPTIATSSAEIEERLKEFYERERLPFGRLELMTGIQERRFWEKNMRPSAGAILAGGKALQKSGLHAQQIEALAFCSVSRDFLEPATASVVHHGLGLSPDCMVFDISNACLGFLNGIILLAQMIENGQIQNGMIVSSESGAPLVEQTIRRILSDPTMNRSRFKHSFASLTIGSGAVACIVSVRTSTRKAYLLKGASARAATQWVDLCRGDAVNLEQTQSSGFDGGEMPDMSTDSEAMLHAGVKLASENWALLKAGLQWSNEMPSFFVCHQVGKAHQSLLFQELGLDLAKDHPTYSKYGNTGSAALPMALADLQETQKLKNHDLLALLGIGSGLNSLMLGIEYQHHE